MRTVFEYNTQFSGKRTLYSSENVSSRKIKKFNNKVETCYSLHSLCDSKVDIDPFFYSAKPHSFYIISDDDELSTYLSFDTTYLLNPSKHEKFKFIKYFTITDEEILECQSIINEVYNLKKSLKWSHGELLSLGTDFINMVQCTSLYDVYFITGDGVISVNDLPFIKTKISVNTQNVFYDIRMDMYQKAYDTFYSIADSIISKRINEIKQLNDLKNRYLKIMRIK